MTSLILPEHLAKKIKGKKEEEASNTPDALSEAYVKAEERVLDPSKLPQSALDRLPQPTGWRLLVLPYRGKAKTKGDVYLPDEYVERVSLATVVAYVLAVGQDCYADKNKFQNGPWCKKGDWIILGRYAGARFRIEGGEVRIINDDEVIATIADPDDIMNV
jgi:co-chaperonin GroES (HSP10)